MPNSDRVIKVFKKDRQSGSMQEIYSGPDKRTYDQDYTPRNGWGLTVADMVKYGTMIVVSSVFLLNLSSGQKQIVDGMVSVKDYMESADAWNSSYFGVPFHGGKPMDGTFKAKREGGSI